MPGEIILGIDFGTSDSSAAWVAGGRVRLVLDAGDSHVPSVVHVPEHGELVAGRDAVRLAASQPARTIGSVKRLLGRAYADPEVRVLDLGVGYRLEAGPGGAAVVVAGRDVFPAVQLAAAVIRRLVTLAAAQAGGAIQRAVLGVPVAATPAYHAALQQAAALAGLDEVAIVQEPVAGAWGCRLPAVRGPRRLLVCDFGGGTFDCSLIVQDGARLEVAGSAGDAFLGGDDLDEALANAVAGEVFRRARVDLRRDALAWSGLVRDAERCKRTLSTRDHAGLALPELAGAGGSASVQRQWIEPRWQPLADRAAGLAQDLLTSARWPAQLVDDVILIGGTSLVPLVRHTFARRTGRTPLALPTADVSVAVGLAILGDAAAGRETAAV